METRTAPHRPERGAFSFANVLFKPRKPRPRTQKPTYTEAKEISPDPSKTGGESAQEETGRIEGRVVRVGTGEPIRSFEIMQCEGSVDTRTTEDFLAGNEVRTFSEDSFNSETSWLPVTFTPVHSEEGRFAFDSVEIGKQSVIARAAGCVPGFQTVEVKKDETTSGVIIYLGDGIAVEGIVVDEQDAPVAGALVVINDVRISFAQAHATEREEETAPFPINPELEKNAAAVSGADGTFRLEHLFPNARVLTVFHRDYAPTSVPLPAPARRTARIRVILTSGGVVEGIVRDHGKPVGGTGIYLAYADEERANLRFSTQTQADGTYRFTTLMPGEAQVSCNQRQSAESAYPCNGSQSQPVLIENNKTTVADFDLGSGSAAIEGTISVRAPQPFEAKITGTVQDATGFSETFGTAADSDGRYRIEGLPAGEVTLELNVALVFFPGGDSVEEWKRSVTLTLHDSETVRQDFEFGAPGIIAGRVRGSKAEMEGGVLVFRGEFVLPPPGKLLQKYEKLIESHLVAVGEIDIEAEDTFRIEWVEPGLYTVYAVAFSDRKEGQTDAEMLAAMRTVSAVVEVLENQETWVDLAAP